MAERTVTGGYVIAEMLKAEGVEVVFGIVDGTYLGLCTALRELDIRIITPRHETSAVHMAGAYARLTGRLGVCLASNGPGVANALPGVAAENGEGNRVLLLTSSRRTGITYPDRGGTYQYFDQTGVISGMAKSSQAVSSFARIPELMRRAFRYSWSGRPGVVHVDVPEDVMNTKADRGAASLEPRRYRRSAVIEPAPSLVVQAVEVLLSADLPVIHAGSGVLHAGASSQVQKLADLLQAPITTSWGGRGATDERSDLAIPMIHVELNTEVHNQADLVLALGTRFGETDWWGKQPYWRSPEEQKVIQVDCDDSILGLNRPVDVAVLADIRRFLETLLVELEGRREEMGSLEGRKKAVAAFAKAKGEARAKLDERRGKQVDFVHPADVAPTCDQVFGEDTVLVVDGGNTAIWANFYHQVRVPHTVLSTFKFGMLGAGVSQALGAQVARPEARVCCIIGDGAFGFHPQEVETAVRNELPVVYVVLCDRQWGMVKMTQQFALKPLKTFFRKSLSEEETINADLGEIRFDELGEAMGAYGERVSRPGDLAPALERAREAGRCAVVHVDVDPVEHMWAPALKHFKNMHTEPKGK